MALWKYLKPEDIKLLNNALADIEILKNYYYNNLMRDGTALIPNQIIQSPVPLTSANLHLLDGALLSGDGAYAKYVAMMGELYNADPTATCWTTESDWQTSNTNYGFCGKFVYDNVANTVRLPKTNSEHGELIKSYSNGTEWYRIYQDGWCEQGGRRTDAEPQISLFIPYVNTNYNVQLRTDYFNAGTISGNFWAVTKTVNSFSTAQAQSAIPIDWIAFGYCNISDLQTAPIYEYIVLGTVSKTDILIDIDNVLTDLNGKADNDFSNVTAPTQAFKDMSIGWVMPDYSTAVTYPITTTEQTLVVPYDCLLVFESVGYNGNYCTLYIDDVLLIKRTSNMNTFDMGCHFSGYVKKGSIVKYKSGYTNGSYYGATNLLTLFKI